MKFLCVECDAVMGLVDRQLPGDGTMAAVYHCTGCAREIALLTNPMETRLVSGMGIQVGGREVPPQPMELTRTSLEGGGEDVFVEPGEASPEAAGAAARTEPAAVPPSRPSGLWSPEALERLENVPSFVRGMVKRIYTDWAEQQGVTRMTPETMDRARSELGLEGM